MRTTSRRTLRLGIVIVAALAAAVVPRAARAEADTFGVGDGHRGSKTVVGDEVVNSYAPLTADAAAGATALAISTVIGGGGAFAAGDLVLVWRGTGVAPSEAPSGNQTKRLDLGAALALTSSGPSQPGLVGTFELARVASVAGSTLTLTQPLVHGVTKNFTEVVRVPEYTDVTVPAATSIAATAWQSVGDGWAGGIVAFLVSGTLTNGGTISATGRGFRGGPPVPRLLNLSLACPNEDGTPQNGYAEKGEGVVESAYGPNQGGKGNVALAAGGGNCIEGGGGGGANFGNGGKGGGAVLDLGTGGNGGIGVDYSLLDRFTMGGGGGAGEQKNGQASAGGVGGGVVYVRGTTLAGKGKIEANGATAANAGVLNLPAGVESDGAGGGGAGGTIVLRFVDNADCDAVAGTGGNGGNTAVAGLSIFGPGGGGGGGRVLFQAASVDPSCKIDVGPGQPGSGGSGGAGGGGGGGTQPPPSGCTCIAPFCTPAQSCSDPTPICDTGSGICKACGGPFGSGLPLACAVATQPVCTTSGDCQPCAADLGTGDPKACQLVSEPYCVLSGGSQGSCGRCVSDGDCVGHPSGPKCNLNAGACGAACTKDSDCKPTEWCAIADPIGDSVCVPKTPNSQPLSPIDPIDGQCTDANGQRTCLSAVCEQDDDLCGKRNSSPCAGNAQCRSAICFTDQLCGLPDGEPCTGNGQCRSDECTGGVCGGCSVDDDCKIGQVCNQATSQCVDGCRPGADAGAHGSCPNGEVCIAPDSGTIGQCSGADGGTGSDGGDGGGNDGGAGNADAGDLRGLVEGGGCSCELPPGAASSPLSIGGALVSMLALGWRRIRRRAGSKRGGAA